MSVYKFVAMIAFFFTLISNAQKVSLRGVVSDSIQQPLAYVTLMAKSSDINSSMPYAITNLKGEYNLELHKGVLYTISVGSMGFETIDFDYTPMFDSEKNIELKENVTQLGEVVIDMPISVKKDTITYRIDKFITGEERKLQDILKKLPGIEVDENGVVTSNGKRITHLLVENKSFFGGDSKLGVENIPANSVDKIEVIDDYNEISFLKGMTRNDDVAMNVKLKENKKSFVFGDIESGTGTDYHYKTHANLFYYHPKLNVNFIGNINDVGENTFTYKDYRNFMGGPSSTFNINDFEQEKNEISQDLESIDDYKSESKVGALNITRTLNDKVELSGYLIFSNFKNEKLNETYNQYLLPSSSYEENIANSRKANRSLGISKLNFKYTPNDQEQWSLDMLLKKSGDIQETSILSVINENELSFDESNDTHSTFANGNLEWHKKISTKHAFSFNTSGKYDKKNLDGFWETNRPISEGLIPYEPQFYMLSLLRETVKKDLRGIFKHYWTTAKYNLIHTTIGNQYREHYFLTNDSQVLDDLTENDFVDNGFGNDLLLKLNDLYLGIYYNTKIGKFNFHQSLFAHNYSWSVNQANTIKRNKWVLLPDLSIRTGSTSSKGFLRLDSKLESSFSDVNTLVNNYYLQSYNSLYIGNNSLENELSHSSSITYSKSNLLRGSYLLSVLNYTYKINGITNSISTDGQDRVFTSRMLHRPSENLNWSMIFRKNVKNFDYKLTTNFFSIQSSELINANISQYKSLIGSYDISVATTHEDFPVIGIGFKQSMGKYAAGNIENKFIVNEPFFKIDYDFMKRFLFSFDYTYYIYHNKSIQFTNSYSMSNMSLSYEKQNSARGFKLSGQNLFDVSFKNQNSFNVYVVSDSKTYVLPRIIMFSLIYNL